MPTTGLLMSLDLMVGTIWYSQQREENGVDVQAMVALLWVALSAENAMLDYAFLVLLVSTSQRRLFSY